MVQPSVRILSADDAACAARELESPSEVRQFVALAAESGSVRKFLGTPEWAAIHHRIMGDDKTPSGRPNSLADVSRFMRWTADGLMGLPVSDEVRNAYLHCALEVDTFARIAARTAQASRRPAGADGVVSFGGAMVALRAGARMTRLSWPAGSYVTAQAGYPQGIAINANTAAATGLPQGTNAVFAPYLMKHLADPPRFSPWTPDQDDLFADDWQIAGG